MLDKRLKGCSILLLVFLLSNASGSLLETSIHTKAAVSESESAPASEAEELVVGEGKRRSLAAAGGGGGMFCVALQNADPTALQAGLSWACGQGHADCTAIQPGGPCYKQNDLPALASYAYNDYFQRNANSGATCSFNGTATTTTADPSSGQCIFSRSAMQLHGGIEHHAAGGERARRRRPVHAGVQRLVDIRGEPEQRPESSRRRRRRPLRRSPGALLAAAGVAALLPLLPLIKHSLDRCRFRTGDRVALACFVPA